MTTPVDNHQLKRDLYRWAIEMPAHLQRKLRRLSDAERDVLWRFMQDAVELNK